MLAVRRISFLASCSLALGLAACSSSVDKLGNPTLDGAVSDTGGLDPDSGIDLGDSDLPIENLELTPSNATVYIDTATTPPTAGTLAFVGKLTRSDGTVEDVTSSLTFSVEDTSLGSFSGATFTSVGSLPGSTQVMTTIVDASGNGKIARANLTVVQIRKSGGQRDFYFEVPYNLPPTPDKDVLGFGTDLKNADVAFSVDTTGSMGTSITNLKTNLAAMVPKLVAKIPSVALGVVDFRDTGDTPFVLVRSVETTTVATVQSAINAMSAGGGGDEPEADIASMYHIVTGAAVGTTAAHTPPTGFWGGVNFRPGSVPVVVNITDATWHDPVGGATMAGLQAAMKAKNVRYVGVTDTHFSASVEAQANTLSDATSSSLPTTAFGTSGQCPTGQNGANRPPITVGGMSVCRLNFLINNGAPLTDQVVTAISGIAVGSTFDITAIPSNDTANAGGVDATKFIKALRAMEEGYAGETCAPQTGKVKDTDGDGIADTFVQITANKSNRVCFEVIPKMNDFVQPTSVAQIFRAFIDVVGMPGAVNLGDRRQVLFLVPPKDLATQ
jgi:hypothetical protein